jgi:signal transduction histidine kinase
MGSIPWPQRLSWQLWTSHFTVVVITLVALVGSIVLLAGLWLLRQGFILRDPALDAQVLSNTIGNLVRRGAPEEQLSGVLAALPNGGLRLPMGTFDPPRGPRWGPGPPPALRGPDLQNLDFVAVVGPDGRVLGSSDRDRFPPGSSFPPPAQSEWAEVTARALAGERDPADLSTQQRGGLAFGAYPIVDPASGRPLAALVLAKPAAIPHDLATMIGRAVAAFGLATTAVLAVSSGFALTFSALAAYLLSRRLSGRLERLSQAADAVARGDLEQRVEPGQGDEVGRLAEHFNLMAERLCGTIAALEVEKERAEASLRAKRELVANVSHELRTPLALIRGHVESLAMAEADQRGPAARVDQPGPTGWPATDSDGPAAVERAEIRTGAGDSQAGAGAEQRGRYLAVIEREVDHLSRLIDDLFALSTAEAGALPLKLEPLPLGEVVGEVADAVAPIARRERQITLVNEVGPNAPAVLADRQRLGQVLANLVRNALRYTPEGGLISLASVQRNGLVEVAVADTGLGIPPEDLPRVFDRFYRADLSRDRAGGGAGLGLAIVRELVEAMGGQVAAESTPGEGSRFSFTLPVAK